MKLHCRTRWFGALILSLILIPSLAIAQEDDTDPIEEEDIFKAVEAMPEAPKPKIMTRALTPALAAIAQQVDQVTTMANRYRREGEFQKAEESLAHFPPNKAIELDDYSRLALAGANFNLGMTYLRRKRYDDDVSAFERSIKMDTVDAKTAYCLGTAYRKQKKYPEAVEELNRAIRLNSHLASAYFGLGSALLRQGKPEEAKSAFTQATEKNPRHVASHFMLGSVAWKQSDWKAAAAAWQKVIDINPKHQKAKTWLGKAKAKTGEHTTKGRGVRG